MTQAFTGSQSIFAVRTATSPDTYTTIGEVVNVGDLGQSIGRIEATHLLSTAKEYKPDLPDGQEMTVTCNLIPTDTGQAALSTAFAAGTTKAFKYTTPSGGGPKYKTFDGIVVGESIPTTTPNGIVQVVYRIQITGAISAWT